MMKPKKERKYFDYHLTSDCLSTFASLRNHHSLFLSSGHRFRDGRWLGDEDPFYVFHGRENLVLGPNLTFQGTSYYKRAEVPTTGSHPLSTYNWRLGLARGFTSTSIYGDAVVESPEFEVDDYSDHVLDLNARGTSYIRRFRPGNPVASLGQFIGELHDLPRRPIFLQSRAKKFNDLGGEYLNIEFGWKPFVGDLVKLYKTQQTIRDRLDKLIKDNGIPVRKRSKKDVEDDPDDVWESEVARPFSLPESVNDESDPLYYPGLIVLGPDMTGQMAPYLTGASFLRKRVTRRTTYWFCGTFTYYVPDIGSDRWTEKAKKVLFGIDQIPQVLYQVYPWSWLVDWFTNVGDIVSNLSGNAIDHEALKNCYVMKSVVESTTVTYSTYWHKEDFDLAAVNFEIPDGSAQCQFSVDRVLKLRRQASPFGFGLRSADFTNQQWAILAALGTSFLKFR